MKYFIDAYKKYAMFTGRASRAEYWYFVLFYFIFAIAAGILDSMMGSGGENGTGIISGLYYLASIIPCIAVSIRRLHDVDKSGWWLLISFIPLIGSIWLIVIQATKGNPASNQYGPAPVTPTTPTPVATA